MLYLSQPDPVDLKAYADSMKGIVATNVLKAPIPNKAKAFLDEKRIIAILTDQPNKLLRHHKAFMPLIIPGFNEKEYFDYLKIRLKKLKDRSLVDKTIISRYDEGKKLLDIFDYEQVISTSKPKSYKLASLLNRYTCTYCNRLYTNTVITKPEQGKRVNDDHRITRPQFDHWFAHSIYPILGISFYNLIPSCSVCNSSVKGDEIFSLKSHIHPYMQDVKQVFSFSFQHKNLNDFNVKIKVKKGSKIDNHLTSFKIREVYDAHSAMELRDLLDLKYKYSDNYIHTLFNNTFKSFEVSEEEIYRMIFGVEQQEVNYHKRPFSKFKHDIIKELLTIT